MIYFNLSSLSIFYLRNNKLSKFQLTCMNLNKKDWFNGKIRLKIIKHLGCLKLNLI